VVWSFTLHLHHKYPDGSREFLDNEKKVFELQDMERKVVSVEITVRFLPCHLDHFSIFDQAMFQRLAKTTKNAPKVKEVGLERNSDDFRGTVNQLSMSIHRFLLTYCTEQNISQLVFSLFVSFYLAAS
jgi:hypothetical protein